MRSATGSGTLSSTVCGADPLWGCAFNFTVVMDRQPALAKSSLLIARWRRLPMPVRRGLVAGRRLSHPGHMPRPRVQVEIVDGVAVITFDDGKGNSVPTTHEQPAL